MAMEMTLTLTEQYAEYQYRVAERIGIMCENDTTNQELLQSARFAAEREAQEWQRRYLAENPRDGQREMLL